MRSTVCGRYDRHGLVVLRGAVLRGFRDGVLSVREVADADAYERVLSGRFTLAPTGIGSLWPVVQGAPRRLDEHADGRPLVAVYAGRLGLVLRRRGPSAHWPPRVVASWADRLLDQVEDRRVD